MKFLKQETTGIGEEAVKTETLILSKDIKVGDDIHICRHEEGLPCSIENVKPTSTIKSDAN
jgi:hypothetical protein